MLVNLQTLISLFHHNGLGNLNNKAFIPFQNTIEQNIHIIKSQYHVVLMAQLLSGPIIIAIVIRLPSPHPNPAPALSSQVIPHNCNQYVMLNQGRKLNYYL